MVRIRAKPLDILPTIHEDEDSCPAVTHLPLYTFQKLYFPSDFQDEDFQNMLASKEIVLKSLERKPTANGITTYSVIFQTSYIYDEVMKAVQRSVSERGSNFIKNKICSDKFSVSCLNQKQISFLFKNRTIVMNEFTVDCIIKSKRVKFTNELSLTF